MLRWAALLGLVLAVAGLSRVDDHAAEPGTQPAAQSPRASFGVAQGMTVAQVRRRMVDRKAYPTRFHGSRCVMYVGKGPRPVLTRVCFDKANLVSRVESGRAPQTGGPPSPWR